MELFSWFSVLNFQKKLTSSLKSCQRKIKKQLKVVYKKVKQVAENPYQFKPLKKPMQNKRRVHIGSFVLVYSINKRSRKVKFLGYAHHDEAYK